MGPLCYEEQLMCHAANSCAYSVLFTHFCVDSSKCMLQVMRSQDGALVLRVHRPGQTRCHHELHLLRVTSSVGM